ncbi:MAG: hypothetical protein AAF430_23925 [Myxococcota bacterium]
MRRVVLVVIAAGALLACAHAESDPAPSVSPAADSVRQLLDQSEFSFADPELLVRYRASGPYLLVDEGPDRMRFEASAGAGAPAALVTVERRGDQLWASFRFSEREFLTRLQ